MLPRILLVILILILIGGTSYIVYRNSKVASLSSKTANDQFISIVSEELKKIGQKYSSQVLDKNDLGVWWVASDNLNIINDGASGPELHIFGCTNPNEKTFGEVAQETGSKIEEIMKQNGFQENLQNSSKSIDDKEFYDYIKAYQKGNTRCTLTANPDCHSLIGEEKVYYSYSFSCTEDFDSNYAQQAPYLKDLNIKDAIIHVKSKSGDFVNLNVNYRRSGHSTIAKLESGKWKEIFSGQDLPSCKTLEQYQVPKEVQSECY